MERGVRQVNSLAYNLTKAQQIPNTSTYKPTNPQTRELTRILTQRLKNDSSVKWIDVSHVGIYKKLVLCIFVVTKLQEHEYQHNAKRLRRLPTRLSESALRR